MADDAPDDPAARTPRGATLHDVAQLAGVSAITVSRALRSPQQLAASTLARVRAAVERTGYVPNLVAGGLRSALTTAAVVDMGMLPDVAHIKGGFGAWKKAGGKVQDKPSRRRG